MKKMRFQVSAACCESFANLQEGTLERRLFQIVGAAE